MEFYKASFIAAAVFFAAARALAAKVKSSPLPARKSAFAAAWLYRIFFVFAISGAAGYFFEGKGGLAVFLSSFAVVALVETVLMRVNIFVISSLIPNNLSPYFPTESSWLSGKPYSDLAEKIRASGFKKLFSARNFNSDGSECDMLTVFSNEGGSVIAGVIFENYGGGVYATYMFCSKICPNPGSGARYIVSSNMALARGFKHASDVLMRRYPFVSGFFKLLKIHQKRLADSGRPAASLENLTLERVQEYLDRTFIFNVDSGILNAEKDAAELGVWTDEGKYRLWVETILLSYFGAAPD